MQQLWVALLAVGTTLFSSGVCGSVLHGVASGALDYPQIIPIELVYSNVKLPVILPQLHGVSTYEDSGVTGNLREKTSTPVDDSLEVAGIQQEISPATPVETSAETSKHKFIVQEQLYEQIFGRTSESSAGNNAIENELTATGVDTVIPSSVQTKIHVSPTVADLIIPQSKSESSSIQSSASPTTVASEPEDTLYHTPPTALPKGRVGEVYINAEDGKLQMQASLLSGGEELKASNVDIPKFVGDSITVLTPLSPSSGITKESKPHIVTNVNVNVNVNGDGTGSNINSTSVAEITAPIKSNNEKCD